MSKITKVLFVLCLGFVGLPQALAQSEEAADSNIIEVPSSDNQVMEAPSAESPELDRLMYVTIGEAQVPKLLVQQFNFRPSMNRRDVIFGIRLVGTQAVVDIRRAEVELRNGQVFSLNRLRGFLRTGQNRRVFLGPNGARIRTIRIWATSPNLVGSRGAFRADVLVDR